MRERCLAQEHSKNVYGQGLNLDCSIQSRTITPLPEEIAEAKATAFVFNF